MKITSGMRHVHEIGCDIFLEPGQTVEIDEKKQQTLLNDAYFNKLVEKGLLSVSIGTQEDHYKIAKQKAKEAKEAEAAIAKQQKLSTPKESDESHKSQKK